MTIAGLYLERKKSPPNDNNNAFSFHRHLLNRQRTESVQDVIAKQIQNNLSKAKIISLAWEPASRTKGSMKATA